MSIYGSIGFTRRDRTPRHWQKDYPLTPKAKKLIAELHAEREKTHRLYEDLPLDTPDEEFDKVWKEAGKRLNELIEEEDRIRRANER